MLNGNKVTPEDVQNAVVETVYDVLSDGKTTVCTLTLYNGFTVRGESSVVDPANFNEQLGQQYARQKALDNVWPVLGAILAEKLYHLRSLDDEGELTDEVAAEFATVFAKASYAKDGTPSYYSDDFVPHDWVIRAVQFTYQFGVCAGLNSQVSKDLPSKPDSAEEH